jgi:hypothetical protein
VGSTRRVFVVKGERLEDRIVTIAQSTGGQVEIATGLEAGDVVALPDGQPLAEGTLVRATTRAPSAGPVME